MQFRRFLVVGASATLIQYGLLVCFVELIGTSPVIASVVSYVLSSGWNYLLNYHFTFSSNASHVSSVSKFCLVAVSGLALNTAIMFFLIDVADIQYILSQIIATVTVMIWNFFAHKYWTYKSIS